NPDGDAIGSSLALKSYLEMKGHTATVIFPTDYPPIFLYLEGIESSLVSVAQMEESTHVIETSDILFFLDFNGLDRIDRLGPVVQESEAFKIMIDHHLDPEPIADWELTDPKASSTCELIHVFIDMLGDKFMIDQEMGTAIFTGLLTDTGSFKFSTNERLFQIASHLKAIGVDDYGLQNKLFNSLTEKQLKLIGHCIANRMEVLSDLQTGIIFLNKDDFRKFRIQRGDTEGIVNYVLMMEKMRIAIFVTDQNGTIKMSFRSKGDISIQGLARDYFNGGGHKNASGGVGKQSLTETIEYLKGVLPGYLESQGVLHKLRS
ncbi:MAG: bifunctional oligoribonuclease/PAP phosphatase NrnA, partial [Bacteroidetes bacterium]